MQKAVIATLDEKFLEMTTADSDRFVYCNYVMPLLITAADNVTPILPDYKRTLLNTFAQNGIIDLAEIKKALPALGLAEVMSHNGLAFDRPPPVRDAGDVMPESRDRSVLDVIGDVTTLLNTVGNTLPANDKILEAAREKLDQARESIGSGTLDFRKFLLPPPSPPPSVDEMIQSFLGLLQSDIAYFFLDRTRIQPKGCRVGEHVYGLSLAPNEEVTLEQKTFTKRQATFEEQSEQEAEFDLELASTLSTELQEGFERQKTITDTWGLNVGKTGSYSSPIISDVAYGSFNTDHTFQHSKNVTDADQETRRRSTKDSRTASAKVAAKYRTAHKTTFTVSTERGFETTTKRVIRNPNAFTPVTLHYFKILQLVEMRHERYGVRLGWMPSVENPASGFFEQIRAGKAKILSDAELALPKKPEWQNVGGGNSGNNAPPETKWFASPIINVSTGDAAGSISTDVNVEVPFDDGWEWERETTIDVMKLGPRPTANYSAHVKGLPLVVPRSGGAGSALRVIIHVGAKVENQWPHRGMEFQVNAHFRKPVQINPQANPAASQEADAYALALRDWEARCDELRAQARKEATEWEAMMLRNLNPVAEIISQITKSPNFFPSNMRNEAWEIDLWQKLFDWERASYVPYPGWWADGPLRDPTRDPSDFINASWARVYLPVRVGMERLALRWMHRRTTAPLDAATEARFDTIEADLKQYRKKRFGDETETMDPDNGGAFREKYDTIATWTDLMPTDGTHLEVVQASTMAADEMTLKDAEAALQLRQALIDSQKEDARLKAKAYHQITQPASLQVKIKPSGAPDGSS